MKKLLSVLLLWSSVCFGQNPSFQSVKIIGSGSGVSTVLSSTNSGALLVNGGVAVISGTTSATQIPGVLGWVMPAFLNDSKSPSYPATSDNLYFTFSQDLTNFGGISNNPVYIPSGTGSAGGVHDPITIWYNAQWITCYTSDGFATTTPSQWGLVTSTDLAHQTFAGFVSTGTTVFSGSMPLHTWGPSWFVDWSGNLYVTIAMYPPSGPNAQLWMYTHSGTNLTTGWGQGVDTTIRGTDLDGAPLQTGSNTFWMFCEGGPALIYSATNATGPYALSGTMTGFNVEGPHPTQTGSNTYRFLGDPEIFISGSQSAYVDGTLNGSTWSFGTEHLIKTDGLNYSGKSAIPITTPQQLASITAGMVGATKNRYDYLTATNLITTGSTQLGNLIINGQFLTGTAAGLGVLGTGGFPLGTVTTNLLNVGGVSGTGAAIFGGWEFNGNFLTGTTAGTNLFFGTGGAPIPNANITNLAIIGGSKIVIGSGTITLTGTGGTASTVTSGTGTETFPITTGTLLNNINGLATSGSGTVVVPSGTLSVTISSLSGTGAIAGAIPDQSKLLIGNPSNLPAGAIPTPVITASGTIVVTVTSGLGLTGTNTMVIPTGTYHYGVSP